MSRRPQRPRRPRAMAGAVTFAAAVLATVSACGGTSTASSVSTPTQSSTATTVQGAGAFDRWPGEVFSPYFESWTNGSLPSLASQSGVKYFNLGFLYAASAGSCTLTWDGDSSQPADDSTFVSQIAQLKQQGGNVALTLGGQTPGNNGTEIAEACSSTSAIAADYESLISTYHVTRLDMDIELGALDNTAAIARRNKAIAMTQAWAARRGYPLQIQYTLPVQPSGLQSNALAVLQNAAAEGAQVGLVNILAFDYYDLSGDGSGQVNMGSAALSAAASVHGQLASLYGKDSQQQLWAMEGITFLPGIDDNPNKTEVTSLSDAREILDYGREHKIGLLSMWAIERDNGGCPGSTDSNTCSGISQGTWAFSHMLEDFTS